jgi:hypothetical protein
MLEALTGLEAQRPSWPPNEEALWLTDPAEKSWRRGIAMLHEGASSPAFDREWLPNGLFGPHELPGMKVTQHDQDYWVGLHETPRTRKRQRPEEIEFHVSRASSPSFNSIATMTATRRDEAGLTEVPAPQSDADRTPSPVSSSTCHPDSVDHKTEPAPNDTEALAMSDGQTPSDPFLHSWRLGIVITSLAFACFLVALDTNVVGVAVPKITEQFDSLDDIGWYGSAYLLMVTALQPSFGVCYKLFNTKLTLVACIGVFECENDSSQYEE